MRHLFFIFTLFAVAMPTAAQTYSAKLVGGGFCGHVHGLNNLGQIVGRTCSTGGGNLGKAFVTDINGNAPRLLVSGNEFISFATDINDSGQVVGYSVFNQYMDHRRTPFSGTYQAGVSYFNPGVSWANNVGATNINNNGQIVFEASDGRQNRVLTTGAGGVGLYDLGYLGNGAPSYNTATSTAINDSGQVVGYSPTNNLGGDVAFISRSDYSGLDQITNSFSRAFGINNSGKVVGFSNSTGRGEIFIFDSQSQNFQILTGISGYHNEAHSINDFGVIVGQYGIGHFLGAFVSDRHTNGVVDLNTVTIEAIRGEVSFSNAVAVNNNGQIVAEGTNGIYLLTPVPEPTTYAMMLIGLLGIVLSRRKISRII